MRLQPVMVTYVYKSQMLAILADDEDWLVRERVAEHPNADVATLKKLAGDRHWGVCHIVAKHKNTPTAVLTFLAGHTHQWVRYGVATNKNAPAQTIATLTNDISPDVSAAAKKNR